MEIVAKKDIAHYNRALGKFISTERQYRDEMKRQGCIPKERADEIAKYARDKERKEYKPTKEHLQFLNGVKNRADKKGNVKLSDREIDYIRKKGSIERPKFRGTEGGWTDAL